MTAIRRNLQINADRLWATIQETAHFGGTPKGGVCRLALSEEDRAVRDWLVEQAKSAGLTVSVDEMGSIFALRPGRDMSRLPVGVGSHLDTQPTGGKFDGILGVLAGLEVMRALDDAGIETEAPLCLVNWTNEEGSRFAPGMTASAVYAGELDKTTALGLRDRDGITFGEALGSIGYAGPVPVGSQRFATMVELHIEQGPVLEAAGTTIGVVTHAKGMIWLDGAIRGQESHAGTTPMPLRRDALSAFSELALALERIALAEGPDGVGTVGVLEIPRASRNVIPGEVRFTAELRHPEADALARMDAALKAAVAEIGERRRVAVSLEEVWRKAPIAFDPSVAEAVSQSARELGLSQQTITSGAGHDACLVASVAPTAMIFVPCKDGLSHNEAESATKEDCAAGANVLLRTILSLSGVAPPA